MTYPTDDLGHPQVDFVWGNIPMQPNDERGMATLDPALDNHVIAAEGYSNYPSFIPNYDGLNQYNNLNVLINEDSQGDGDPDAGLEVVIPDFVRLTLSAAGDLADKSALSLNTISHVLTATYVESTAKVVRVTAYDTDYGNWGNSSSEALIGLRVGDELNLSNLTDTSDPAVSLELGTVKVTKVNNDGDQSWFEFKSATELALDTAASGTVYAGPNLVNIVTVQRPNHTAPGAIANVERWVNVRYIGD